MPNWCECKLEIKHASAEMIDRLVDAFEERGIFTEFCTPPTELKERAKEMNEPNNPRLDELRQDNFKKYGATDYAEWRLQHWGTHSDVGKPKSLDKLVRLNERAVRGEFYTAWSPPLHVLDRMVELGFSIKGQIDEEAGFFSLLYHNGWRKSIAPVNDLNREEEEDWSPPEPIDQLFQRTFVDA